MHMISGLTTCYLIILFGIYVEPFIFITRKYGQMVLFRNKMLYIISTCPLYMAHSPKLQIIPMYVCGRM